MNQYRQSSAYRLAAITAAVQKAALRHRVALLGNVRGTPCVIRKRKTVRS